MTTGIYRILLVEDHYDSARALSILLRSLGHVVRVAGTAQAAVELYLNEVFDVLLCDLGLPDKDGCDLLKELHQQRPVRAIAVTGFGMYEDVERSLSAGFSNHVTKPVSMDKLRKVIDGLSDFPPSPPTIRGGDGGMNFG